MSKRPDRIVVTDETGNKKSLPEGPDQFRQLGSGPHMVFLGLGPKPAVFPYAQRGGKETYFLECPEFERQMSVSWLASMPGSFKRLKPEDLTTDFIRASTLFIYAPNLKLFPGFWGPLWAKMAALSGDMGLSAQKVWIPANENALLARELAQGFQAQGLTPEFLPGQSAPGLLVNKLRKTRPKIFFSVNMNGLDNFGDTFYLLREFGIKTGVWFVDNPFHLLTRIKSNYWKEIPLFVTDDWFIRPLRHLGAKSVTHLPLAAAQHFFTNAQGQDQGLSNKMVFVGRSSFPGKNSFFAGCGLDPDLEQKALKAMENGLRPDFAWFAKQMDSPEFWPGNQVREVGLAAETLNQTMRAQNLKFAQELGLTVYGDPDWLGLVNLSDLRQPVDYYGPLPSIYRQAKACLNLTSLLLPHGLTQRHFDVWASGGFLITDNTPGLSIFPPELVRTVTFNNNMEMFEIFNRAGNSDFRNKTIADWQRHIIDHHTYEHRVKTILNNI